MASQYNPQKIEKKWQKEWQAKKVYEPDLKKAKKPFYNLMMFPYPSAEGLHIGGARTFTGVDIYGRYKRHMGYDVFEPMGLDGFGIHSENYAMKIGAHPMKYANVTEKNFYRQLGFMGNGFAWNERLETYDPEYYKWTQWIFIQLFKAGLAYRKKQAVNWCPSCMTVLADEQVIQGKCERCSTVVIKKDLEQWFFKITKYAERLLKNLETLDWTESVTIAQRNWIGKSEGAELPFAIRSQSEGTMQETEEVVVFTTRPDTIYGVTYLVLAPEHPLLKRLEFGIKNKGKVDAYILEAISKPEEDRIAEGKEKSGVMLEGVTAVNPATGEEIPVWVADYVLGYYGTGAVMAVPGHDKRDFEFAKKYKLPIKKVVTAPHGDHEADHETTARAMETDECYEGNGILVHSGIFNGKSSEGSKWEMVEEAGGSRKVQYRLRDWLISRQRYWGAPIPMIFCSSCEATEKGERKDMPGWYTVPEKQLPVKLPFVKDFRPTGSGKSPLASVKSFYEVKCPSCKGKARRETDVSDTFLDSAWYYLRYPSAYNKKQAWDPQITKKFLPVHSYIGGAEHSVLHLLYSRFVTMALKDMKYVKFEEPFMKFRAHGLITKDGAKMSKSKGNVVSPDEYFGRFGADVMRAYLAFLAPFEQGGDFRDEGILGTKRFLDRVWKMGDQAHIGKPSLELKRALHKTIKKVGEDLDLLRYNTAISALMILLNTMEAHEAEMDTETWQTFLILLAPLAPHITEELWQRAHKSKSFSAKTSIHRAPWPKVNKKLLVEDMILLIIQVNGKTRHTLQVAAGITEAQALKLALAEDRVKMHLNDMEPKRVIYVPGRLINLVMPTNE